MKTENRHINIQEPEGMMLLRYIKDTASNEEKSYIEAWLEADENNKRVLLQTARIYYANNAMERIAREHLPENIGLEWSGLSYQEKQAGGQTGFVLALVFLFVFLFLAAQYESWIVPIAVLLSLPVATLGAYLGIWATGLENDIYYQIGLVTLIGLAAKNAILIVEFALERRRMGMSITWAAVLGAAARLRPILMTSLAMVVGLLPMMFAFGVGAHGNRTLGTAAIGGMFIGMIFQIFIVPVLFVVFQYLQEKFKPIEWEDLDNSDMSTEIEQYAKIK